MSRKSFADRLGRIGKKPKDPVELPQSAPVRRADPMVGDEEAPIWTDIALLVLLAAMAMWLIFDFWRALPIVVIVGLLLGGYSLIRELYLYLTGTRRHRNRSPIWSIFEDLWH